MSVNIVKQMKQGFFSDKFPEYIDPKHLDSIKASFPLYDEAYVAGGMIPHYKTIYEDLWKDFYNYADNHFLKQYKYKEHFLSRCWEMYIGSYLVRNTLQFECMNRGPDFKILSQSNIPIYIEAISVKRGIEPNSVPELIISTDYRDMSVQDIPENQMLLRYCSVLHDKQLKFEEYQKNGLIPKESYQCIAINSHELQHVQRVGIPLIAKALYEIGHLTISLPNSVGDTGTNKPKVFWSHRESVSKEGQDIPMGFFKMESHSCISAVFWSETSVLNHPNVIGSDIYVFHNPNAVYKLDVALFPDMKHVSLENSKLVGL